MTDEREEIARIIEPNSWGVLDQCGGDLSHPYLDQKVVTRGLIETSLTRADAILARDEGSRAVVGGELPMPCYLMSEPHLSGYRIILGYETLTESMDAQDAFSRLARGLVHSLVPAVLPGGDRPDRVAPGPMGAASSVAAAPSPPVAARFDIDAFRGLFEPDRRGIIDEKAINEQTWKLVEAYEALLDEVSPPVADTRAEIIWIDIGIKCPGCGCAIQTGEDWIDMGGGTWSPGDIRSVQGCANGCDIRVEIPDMKIKVADGPA